MENNLISQNNSRQQAGANQTAVKKRVNRIRGQIDGIERMIEDRRYCVDIVHQVKAVQSALDGLKNQILETHLRSCVTTAFKSKSAVETEKKIQEIIDLL